MTMLVQQKWPRSMTSSLHTGEKYAVEPICHILQSGIHAFTLALHHHGYLVFVVRITLHQNDHVMPYQEHLLIKCNDVPEEEEEEEALEDNKVILLLTFTLTAKSEHDVFGLLESHLQDAPKEVLQFVDAPKKL